MAVRPTRVRRLRIHRTIQAATLFAGLCVVGGVVYAATLKQVVLVVDGRPEAISTSSSNVGELLTGQGIALNGSFRVVPSPATLLADGMTVVVSPASGISRLAGPLDQGSFVEHSLADDTAVNQGSTDVGVWVVRGASSGPAARIAAELAKASAFTVGVGSSPEVGVRVVVGGKVRDVLTDASTTGELLSAMGINPDANDRVLPPPKTPLHNGSVVAFDQMSGRHVAAGKATWYDPPWSGLTAASPWIPIGTHVSVTDVQTGRSVIVLIDDRGPFAPGRIIDLSVEAFSQLASPGIGVLDVRVTW